MKLLTPPHLPEPHSCPESKGGEEQMVLRQTPGCAVCPPRAAGAHRESGFSRTWSGLGCRSSHESEPTHRFRTDKITRMRLSNTELAKKEARVHCVTIMQTPASPITQLPKTRPCTGISHLGNGCRKAPPASYARTRSPSCRTGERVLALGSISPVFRELERRAGNGRSC